MPKITPRGKESPIVQAKTREDVQKNRPSAWWLAKSKKDRAAGLVATATFLKEQNQFRYRQASLYSSMYGNLPIFGSAGMGLGRVNASSKLPLDRPTMSVITSCVDTVVSRISQTKPRPIFLTDNGDYKERRLAKQLNGFIAGELYQTKAYNLGELVLRDAAVWGTGCVKVLRDKSNRVALERRILTELLVDPNDALYGDPRQLYELRLVDRGVLADAFPDARSVIEGAQNAYPEAGSEGGKTVSDLVMVVEGWHLPSGPDAGDGMHAIAIVEGPVFEKEWKKPKFPFGFIHYSPQQMGFWGRGLAELLMGNQIEINKLLGTISQAINLVGVPRVFLEQGSKVVKAHLNNQVGAIVTFTGTKPIYEVAPCVPQELYAQLQRLVDYAYQQSGISQLAATSQKPAGLNSGEALREYNDQQTDRFATLSRRWDNLFIDLAYLMTDEAKDIAEDTGSYQTVYPNKNGTKEVDLPESKLLEDPFVIQCFDESSLPRDPAGRAQRIVELMQAGIYSPQEGRRLLGYPDTEQVDKLANASEERILQILDEIVESGKFTPPDPFMDLGLAETLVTQYYNLYLQANLEESKAQKLRDFFAQIQGLKQAAVPPPPPGVSVGAPQANPLPAPQSDLLPNVPMTGT
jgi:hypothetical protein